ncbi:MAG: hypothetical protein Kow00105_19050 [Phycisphaeraceae bacterium]
MAVASSNPSELIDTLKLTNEQWAELAEKLDRVPTDYRGQRRAVRIEYKKLAQIAVAIKVSGTQWTKYVVRSRDLSEGGIGFLHGAYVHEGSACRVILKDLSDKVICIDGQVKHCVHVSGTVHKVGVQFNEKIDLSQFTEASGQADPVPADEAASDGTTDTSEQDNADEAA